MRYGIRGLTQMVWSWKDILRHRASVCVFLKGPQDHEVLKWDWRWIFDVHKKTVAGRFDSRSAFTRSAKKGDDGVRRLQWDDFYMLMRGLTPVKVMVENRFRMAVK